MKGKKLLLLLLSCVLLLSMAACAKEKADKYCSNCGNGVSKNASFCDECGVELGKDETVTSSSVEMTSFTDATTATTTTQNVTTTAAHKHSYKKTVVAPSCTDQGYTVYKCACGKEYKDDYTNAVHSYKEYVCSKCGAVDKKSAYEYLLLWLQQNGEVDGEYLRYSESQESYIYSMQYQASEQVLYLSLLYTANEEGGYVPWIALDFPQNFEGDYYWHYYDAYKITTAASGEIDAKNFTINTPISCEKYDGPEISRNDVLNMAVSGIKLMLVWVEGMYAEQVIDVHIGNMGFEEMHRMFVTQ